MVGAERAGQGDPFIRAAQAGIMKLQPPPRTKMAIRRELALRIVTHCLRSLSADVVLLGIMAALAYLFALRVPSELLRQFCVEIIKFKGNVWTYGSIRRKNCALPVVLQRACICQGRFRTLCPHSWIKHPTLSGARPRFPFRSWTGARFNYTLRQVLADIGMDSSEAIKYCSHDFRRSCAKDLLQHAGPAAMMGHCGWSSQSSALFYVTRDEVYQSIVTSKMADASDEDN